MMMLLVLLMINLGDDDEGSNKLLIMIFLPLTNDSKGHSKLLFCNVTFLIRYPRGKKMAF